MEPHTCFKPRTSWREFRLHALGIVFVCSSFGTPLRFASAGVDLAACDMPNSSATFSVYEHRARQKLTKELNNH